MIKISILNLNIMLELLTAYLNVNVILPVELLQINYML